MSFYKNSVIREIHPKPLDNPTSSTVNKTPKTQMEPQEKDFPILDALSRQSITTQRQLANHAGISLGQVNYILKSLLEKGLVKVTNFTKSPRKISYIYRLTPKGLETKSALAARFVLRKLREYGDVKDQLAERLSVFENQKHYRVFFVGPSLVGELINAVIEEKKRTASNSGCIEVTL